jgi:hypothetical protein
MSLQNLSDLFLYELWTLCAAIKQVIAELLRMSRLTCNYRIRDELKAGADNAKGIGTFFERSSPAISRSWMWTAALQ